MDIMTKVRVLWEKVAGITADVSAVDAKATATAATLAGILPRIPADYSTDEVNTGVKWIDGKDIYCKVFTGTFPEITTTSSQLVGTLLPGCFIVGSVSLLIRSSDQLEYINFFGLYYNYSNGSIYLNSVFSTFSEKDYKCIIYFTKPDPVPAQADNETRKRKTTKKEEK